MVYRIVSNLNALESEDVCSQPAPEGHLQDYRITHCLEAEWQVIVGASALAAALEMYPDQHGFPYHMDWGEGDSEFYRIVKRLKGRTDVIVSGFQNEAKALEFYYDNEPDYEIVSFDEPVVQRVSAEITFEPSFYPVTHMLIEDSGVEVLPVSYAAEWRAIQHRADQAAIKASEDELATLCFPLTSLLASSEIESERE
jgi:hypothetical protein